MADLKDLKQSITELSLDMRIALITASRQRRIGFKNKPNKRVNKKLISALSQAQKLEILKQLKAEQDSENETKD